MASGRPPEPPERPGSRDASSGRVAVLEAQLHADREQTQARLRELAEQFESMAEAAALAVPDDEHDPEGSTIGFERAQVLALIDQARDHLSQLDGALRRVDDGTYGVCAQCGGPIADERLQARPMAQMCIDCAGGRRRAGRPHPPR